jgi:hypothetical protein
VRVRAWTSSPFAFFTPTGALATSTTVIGLPFARMSAALFLPSLAGRVTVGGAVSKSIATFERSAGSTRTATTAPPAESCGM